MPLSGGHRSSGPTGSAGSEFPITANLVNKSEKMNARTILIISASALVVLVFCTGAVFILFKCTKDSRPSDAVGPVFTPSTNKKCGKFVVHEILLTAMIIVLITKHRKG